jgi:hypothetical protein
MEMPMSETTINIFKENDGWFVMAAEKYGPYSREVAEKLAKGMAFAIRSSGGAVKIVVGDTGDPPFPEDPP